VAGILAGQEEAGDLVSAQDAGFSLRAVNRRAINYA
jgi:hypothetical protein